VTHSLAAERRLAQVVDHDCELRMAPGELRDVGEVARVLRREFEHELRLLE
jgi:hypothetical protein